MTNQEQRVCLRCKVVFMGNSDDALCLTCKGGLQRSEERKKRICQQTDPPENPMIECLIKREGVTTAQIGGVGYAFRHNSAGHSVCKVSNPSHHKFLLRQSELYRLYQPDKGPVAP